MKLKEFLKNINEMVEEDPTILEYDVVTCKDDEGNGYNIVFYDAHLGVWDEDEREFYSSEDEIDPNDINAICLN